MADKKTKNRDEILINEKDSRFFLFVVILLSVFVRCCVSLNPYSGAGKAPMFGDYEAQRHWMEITVNLPVEEWYVNSSLNDLQYWGLDYPPLTAYHSWLCGYLANIINPAWVNLNTSRGFESPEHKLFMRYTVLVADVLIYFPAIYVFCTSFYKKGSKISQISVSLVLLLYPGLILIDHGHFQYNCISLGLALWGIICVINDRDILGSIMFSLALNYKQMELYHALPFFSFLLGKALRKKSWVDAIFKVFCLGITVIGTFVLCWLPFLRSFSLAVQVLHRLFPFARGLYEDKVANIWCSISVFVKLKNIFSRSTLLAICGGSTLICLLPSNVMLTLRPSRKSFLLSLVNSSLVFFLFSFQVHEKSILLVTLPTSLLVPLRPVETTWFLSVASFSMIPLLEKDGLLVTYIPCMLLFLLVAFTLHVDFKRTPTTIKLLFLVSMSCSVVLHILSHIIKPPGKYPDIFPLMISMYSCGHFLLFLIYFHVLQYHEYSAGDKTKKQS
ncbi:dolichyl pyrophosphate Man9GlcNAc2 alpha-1,3-glucosyltransferase-like [Dendronephthya gigantea]|uniref:dolichyl pyrophosphate Man9GlcNAc2 alpha-1,3-glucosyltransferase-like n=1 Tax=Dendronephthya gigantea TaxID=151771 RepID=UPI001068F054|nr:dolichyl pyrophosphate Man9GlcNAc2 alpha-1,3-glucosyltransferase-like [Dendronephthya gigantea]